MKLGNRPILLLVAAILFGFAFFLHPASVAACQCPNVTYRTEIFQATGSTCGQAESYVYSQGMVQADLNCKDLDQSPVGSCRVRLEITTPCDESLQVSGRVTYSCWSSCMLDW